MVRPQGAVFWQGLGALFALLLNASALLLPLGLMGSPLHALGTAIALGWLGGAWGMLRARRSPLLLASMLLLGIQLLGYACGWAHGVAFFGLLGVPVWALTAVPLLISSSV